MMAPEQTPWIMTSCASIYTNLACFSQIFIQQNRESNRREVPTEVPTIMVSDPLKIRPKSKKLGCSVRYDAQQSSSDEEVKDVLGYVTTVVNRGGSVDATRAGTKHR